MGLKSLTSNLTKEEVAVLAEEFNLADGHAYRSWNVAEAALVDGVADLFRHADRRDQPMIENRFLETFFAAAHQSYRPDAFAFKLCFTASTALEVIANFLRLRGFSAALVEPCFDNLHDILARHKVPLTSLDEKLMTGKPSCLTAFMEASSADAIFLVSPNNPTGAEIPQDTFVALARACRAQGKLLILDATFRFYAPPDTTYDAYAILAEEGVECFIIEDTGKTWPTLELKAPFFSVPLSLADEMSDIYSDFLLHVSPVSVMLATAFLGLDHRDGLGHTHDLIAHNRKRLSLALKTAPVIDRSASFMSVAWLEVGGGMSGETLRRRLAEQQVHILPGRPFFWRHSHLGEPFLRVALLRDPEMFERAMLRLEAACRGIWSEKGAFA
jgi:aspartate/methionine/tyrosine aminotransferase